MWQALMVAVLLCGCGGGDDPGGDDGEGEALDVPADDAVGGDLADVPEASDAPEGDVEAEQFDADAEADAEDVELEADSAAPDCYSDDDCPDDGIYCNGLWWCNAAGVCEHRMISCRDDLPCTIDRCDEEIGACVHTCMTGYDNDGDGCCRFSAGCGTDCNDDVPGGCTAPDC